MKNISVAVTTFNRYDLTIKSFEKIIDHPQVSEIIVVDDASTNGDGKRLADYFKGHPKVKVIRQAINRTMQRNKADAVSFANNNWVALIDSDNEINSDYLDTFLSIENPQPDTIYAPQRATPQFLYDDFAGATIDKFNVKGYIKVPLFGALINTCNYIVHRDTYINTFEYQPEIKGTDTAAHFLRHLKNGGKFHVVKGMEYIHAISNDSEFMKDVHFNMASAMDIEKKLLEI